MFDFSSLFQDNTDYQGVLAEIASGEAQLVDIREKGEWDHFRFKDAVHIPLSKLAHGLEIDKL